MRTTSRPRRRMTCAMLWRTAVLFLALSTTSQLCTAAEPGKFRQNQPVTPVSGTTVVAEAEEFATTGAADGWKALPWGANYYAATFANTFLSRKAFLGAPEQILGGESAASITVNIPKAGRYLALVRYEAAPRFETRFTLRIAQNSKTKLERGYGARENLKIWA